MYVWVLILASPSIKPIEASHCIGDKEVRVFLYCLIKLLLGLLVIIYFSFSYVINVNNPLGTCNNEIWIKMQGFRGKIIVSITHFLVVERSYF